MIDLVKISFENSSIEIEKNKALSEQLHVENSPILFGCRTGLCATCLVQVLSSDAPLLPPAEEELEILEVFTDDTSGKTRLACQLKATTSMELKYIGK